MDGLAAAGTDPQAGLELDLRRRGPAIGSGPHGTRRRPARPRAWRRHRTRGGPSGLHDAAPHSCNRARSSASISSVRESESPSGRPSETSLGQAAAGTGTTRPQSGHLPASGRPDARDLQPPAARAEEPDEAVLRLAHADQRARRWVPPAQPDSRTTSRAVDPVRTARLDVDHFAAAAGYPRHRQHRGSRRVLGEHRLRIFLHRIPAPRIRGVLDSIFPIPDGNDSGFFGDTPRPTPPS